MNSNLVSKLPDKYEERVALLKTILKTSMERLAGEAKKRNILHQPFGRPPSPTPLLTEEELIRRGGFSENAEDDVPVFEYDYGFNPLTFLGDLLEWSHPDSVAARNNVILESQRRLTFRAKHAQHQMNTVETLKNSFRNNHSGLYWGPIVYPINKFEVAVVCRVIREGDVIVVVSRNEHFDPIERQIVHPADKNDSTVRVVVNDLVPGVRYFVRCCLKDKNYEDPDFPIMNEEEVEVVEASNRKSMMAPKLQLTSHSNKASTPVESTPIVEEDEIPVHLRPSARFTGLESDHWQTGEFWTLQSEDPNFEEEVESVVEEEMVGSPKATADDSDSEELDIITVCKPLTFVAVGCSAVVHENCYTDQKVKANDGLNSEESKLEAARILRQFRALIPDCRFKSINFNEFTPQMTEEILYSLFVGSNREIEEKSCIATKMKYCFPDAEPKTVKTIADASAQVPVYGALLGDIFNSAVRSQEESTLSSNGLLQDALWRLAVSSGVFCNTLSIFRKASIVIGWDDGSVGAKSGLRAEEVLYKQYSHDLRRYQRKFKLDKKGNPKDGSSASGLPPPPTLVRPPLSFSLDTLNNGLGVQLRDESASARCVFHRYMLGPIVEVYVLDNRNGYLGAEQAKWFRSLMEKSTVPWKFILNGNSFGMTSVAPFTEKQLDAHVNKIKHIYEKRKNSVEDCDPFALDLSDAESLGEESVDSATSATHAADAIDFGEKGNVMAEKIAAREKKKALKHAEDAKDSNEHTLTYILQNIKLATDAPTAFSTKKVGEDEEANIEDTGADAEAPDSPSDISVNENGPGDGFALPDDAYDADDDSVVAIESGIVILTAGLDVPFVAAYDLRNKKEKPSDKGDVYCIEVGVGTMTLATQQQRLRELVNVSDTVTCSETNPVLRNISTDIPHGFDIQPKLAGVDVKLLYGTFMNDFNYYPTTAIKNKTLGEETSLMESATSYSIMEALVEKERSDTKNNEGILHSNSSALSTIEEPAPKVSIVDVISESMVTVDPPSDVYVGPSSCALHLHTDGSLTVLLSNLQTNEKVASFDFTSTVLVNSLETASANGSMSSRSKN